MLEHVPACNFVHSNQRVVSLFQWSKVPFVAPKKEEKRQCFGEDSAFCEGKGFLFCHLLICLR
jgi:hypothetical protein